MMIEIPQSVVNRCRDAKRIGVLTGAGISAESGVATFRGEDGIWTKLNPLELASMDAFLKNPSRVWEWYEHRRNIMLNVQPNDAHFTLAAMEAAYPHFSISTQNIDGLHQRAGSRTVYELHGAISHSRCAKCGVFVETVELKKDATPPRCRCGGLIRPDVVWFGEMLPQDVLEQAHEAARSADVYFSIGTSAVVYPAAQLPYEAVHHGAFVIEINLEPTEFTPHADVSLRGKAGQILPQLWQAIQKRQEIH